MMRSTIPIFVVLAALAMPAHATVADFRLPAEPAAPQPEREGPVAPDVPASRRPAPAPTPTPAPTAAAPAPAPVVTPPVLVSPVAPPSAEPQPTPRAQRPMQVAPSPTSTTSSPAGPVAASPADAPGLAPPVAAPTGGGLAPVPAPTPTEVQEGAGSWWPWALAVLAALAAFGGAGWFWRQRQTNRPVAASRIERPRLVPEPVAAPVRKPEPLPQPVTVAEPVIARDTPPTRVLAPAPAPVSATAGPSARRSASPLPQPTFAEPLQIALEPLRLSLTLMNATLAYRLRVANGGMAALTGLTIGADMISAHASLSREEQLAGPVAGNGGAVQLIERLAAGESRVVEGEFRLPFQQIVPIRQGKAALLLPLARFRLEADGARPVVRTFLVGQPGASERLQPFRLDLGPRIYPNLAQHAFA